MASLIFIASPAFNAVQVTCSSVCVKRQYRVRKNEQFQKIRRRGKSYPNQMLVLCLLPNELSYSRFGFSVSSRIGNAVVRNRLKRQMRESIRLRQDSIEPGWDVVFIARRPIRSADYHQIDVACARLLRRAHLFKEPVSTEIDHTGIDHQVSPEDRPTKT